MNVSIGMRQQLLDCAAMLIRLAHDEQVRPKPGKSQSSVPYAQFQRLLRQKYPHNKTGRGAKRAFLDYAQVELAAGRTKLRITEGMEQSWLRDGEVPAWAHDFLQVIPVLPERPAKKRWTTVEVQYLTNLMRRFPRETYDDYAARCSRRFGRTITLCAIKGCSDREGIGKMGK